MGTEGAQAVLEENPPALMSPRPLHFDRLGLLPLFYHLSRSAQTREKGVTRLPYTARNRRSPAGTANPPYTFGEVPPRAGSVRRTVGVKESLHPEDSTRFCRKVSGWAFSNRDPISGR